MTEQRVTITIADGVADVRLNRPDKRNALDPAMFVGLVGAGERLKSEPGLRAVVLSGTGPDFCAGLDFGSFRAMRDGERLSAQADLPPCHGPARATGQRAAYVWTEIPVPVIAAVTGERPAAGWRSPGHSDRHPGRAAVGARDQVGPGARHDRDPAAPRAGRPGRSQGADLHRPDGPRRRSSGAGPGHPGRSRPVTRPASSWPARSPAQPARHPGGQAAAGPGRPGRPGGRLRRGTAGDRRPDRQPRTRPRRSPPSSGSARPGSPTHRIVLRRSSFMAIRDSVALTEDQRALRDTVRGFLTAQFPSAARHGVLGTGPGYDPKLHARLAGELGLAGLTVPEESAAAAWDRSRHARRHRARPRPVPGPVPAQRRWRWASCSRPVTARWPNAGCRSWPTGR